MKYLIDVKCGELFELAHTDNSPLFVKLPTHEWDDEAWRRAITVDDLLNNCRSFDYYSLETDTKVIVRSDLKLSVTQ